MREQRARQSQTAEPKKERDSYRSKPKYGALQATPPPCPPSLSHAKKPPPKPTKPLHLKLPERRLSTSSEISLPDLDDLEKQFSRRFPSYV